MPSLSSKQAVVSLSFPSAEAIQGNLIRKLHGLAAKSALKVIFCQHALFQSHAPVGVGKGGQALVHLDARRDALLQEHVRHLPAVVARLVQRFLKQDGT